MSEITKPKWCDCGLDGPCYWPECPCGPGPDPKEEYSRRTSYIRALRPHIVWVPPLTEGEFMQRYKPQKGPMR